MLHDRGPLVQTDYPFAGKCHLFGRQGMDQGKCRLVHCQNRPPGHFPEKGALPRHALRKTILESGQKLRLVFPYEGTNLFRDPFLRTNDQAIPVGFDG